MSRKEAEMVTIRSSESKHSTAREADAIRSRMNDPQANDSFLATMKTRVARFEAAYNLKSSELHDAIDDGRLEESSEVCAWLIDYDVVRRAESGADER
jgi:hypothetical protein